MIPTRIITPSKLPLNCHHGVITLFVLLLYCMYCTAFITQSNDGGADDGDSEAVAQQADEMAPDWMLSFEEKKERATAEAVPRSSST